MGKLNDQTTDAKEEAPHGVAILLSKTGQLLSPVRRTMRKLSGDGLLGFIVYAVVYAVVFVGVFNSSTNSMQFGKVILVAIQADQFSKDARHELNRDLVRFIAVAALSIICLVQFFSPRAGRRLNNLAAVVRILFMLLLIIFGGLAASKARKNPTDWTKKNCVFGNGTYSVFPDDTTCCLDSDIDSVLRDTTCFLGDVVDNIIRPDTDNKFAKKGTGSDAWAKAMLLVLFSFEGWENATFVAGEIPQRKENKSVRQGFTTAVILVGILYLCTAAVLLEAFPYGENLQTAVTLNYASYYSSFSLVNDGLENSAKPDAASIRAWAIVIAISCLGSLNSIIYTFSRVKQAIGQANILPWSNIWKSSHTLSKGKREDDINDHGSCLPRLGGRAEALQRDKPDHLFRLWQPRGAGLVVAAVVLLAYIALNVAVLVVVPQVSLTSDGKGQGLPGRYYAAVVFSLVGLALAYYAFVISDLRDQTPGEEASFNVLYWLFGGEWYFRRNDTPWKRFRNWLPG
ncbi:hypothetical protein FJTKL_02697 [Diaporthe vaccinii]|uniref:Amino acid permease/ SLC12A domain-containing protein n=1 Tax=Diaporthe vaccinii TaxID=105482 RepID=A0ABR4DXI6_9PEZI